MLLLGVLSLNDCSLGVDNVVLRSCDELPLLPFKKFTPTSRPLLAAAVGRPIFVRCFALSLCVHLSFRHLCRFRRRVNAFAFLLNTVRNGPIIPQNATLSSVAMVFHFCRFKIEKQVRW